MRPFTSIAAGLILCGCLACSEAEQRDVREEVGAAAAEAEARVEDGVITAAVKARLLSDTTVNGMRIDVDTREGVVTLTGPVQSPDARARAIELAGSTEGVIRVEDRLTVAP